MSLYRPENGPFDIIGDVHGCYNELLALTHKLGYVITHELPNDAPTITHPLGRQMILLGDLADRGPKSPQVLRFAIGLVQSKAGFCVLGNHDLKLLKWLKGHNVNLKHGFDLTIEQLKTESDDFKERVYSFLSSLTSHLIFDKHKLVVAHAGLKEELHGEMSGKAKSFCLFGDTTGTTDANGLPIRRDWAAEYRGKAMVVYGHTPTCEAVWLNNTICIDTGCVFGGKLTALRYPEREIVAEQAYRHYQAYSFTSFSSYH